MMTPAPERERRIAGLRAVIQSTGVGAAWLRWGIVASLGSTLLLFALALIAGTAGSLAGYLWSAVVIAAGVAAALLFTVGYRTLRCREIAGTLSQLTQQEREAILVPLRDQGGDTQKLVAPLLRRFGMPTEVSPAAAPPGRGDEATPASLRPAGENRR